MSVTYPEAVPAQGFTTVFAVLAVADPTAPKVATEINAASSLVLTCFIWGAFNPTVSQNTGQAPQRFCDRGQLNALGNVQYGIDAINYVHDPQSALTVAANKAKNMLTEGLKLYLIERQGLLSTAAGMVAAASGQRGRTHYVRMGTQGPGRTGDGEFDKFQITQQVEYLTPPVDCVFAA